LFERADLYEGHRRLLAYVLVDTGYTGIGIPSRDVVKCVSQLTKSKACLKFCGLMVRTTDDRVDQEYRVDYSINFFQNIFQALEERNIKVPAMILEKHQTSLDEWDAISRQFGEYLEDTQVFARCGTETFGFKSQDAEVPLRRCMSLKAQVRDIRKVWKGEWIGLGEGWQAPISCYVAVISCGFADGFPLITDTTGISIRINNESYEVVGQVQADEIFVRIGDASRPPSVSVGDYAVLFGPVTQDPDNTDFLTLTKSSNISPTSVLCHLSARVTKRWKSTGLTRKNTMSRLSQSKKPKGK
jgi:alanine racemase